MSGNAAGVGGGAAGILHRTLGSGGGGCGELVNGDGTCAAAATATTTTLAQCSERETSVAEAQAYNNRNNTSYIDADVTGENNDGHVVNNMDNAEENRRCADSGEYVLGCLSAVNGQDVHLKEAGSINIDHKPSGSQHGGGHSCFMAAASRKTASRQQRGNTGTSKNTNGESISAENEGSSLTATAENGSRKPDLTVTKRRGCSMSRAPKRVCFAGTTTIAHCGISDSGARGPRLGYSPLRSTGGGHKGLPDGQEGQSGSGAQACGVVSSRAIGRKGPERHTNSIVQNDNIQVPKEQTVEQNGVELTQNNATGVCGDPAEGTALGAERVPVETLSAEALEAGASQAQHRQGQLEERTERLWRRLQVVQVKQMERHVVQQLQGLAGAMGPRREGGRARLQQASRPPHMPSSGELSRLARSCKRWGLHPSLEEHNGRGVLQPTSSPPLPVTPLRASRPSHPPNSSLCSASELPQNALRKKPTEESPHPPPEPPGSPPSAARARPLLRQRRRKLIRLGGSVPLAAKAVSMQCWCTPPAVCVLCADSPPRCPIDKGASPWVQWAQLDLCLHPVLSFPPDVPLALRCGVPPRAGPRSHKPARPAGMPPPPSWLARRGPGSQKPGRLKRRPACAPPLHGILPPAHDRTGERPQRGLVNLPFLCQRTCSTDLTFRPATPPAPDTPTQPTRRRRGESSFDIDNLVMPLGLAGLGGGARVQKLQYKEILTPSWRQLDSPSAVPAGQVPPSPDPPEEEQRATAEQEQEKEQEEEEVEDLSDAAFLYRHAQCEQRERSRWGSWAQRRRRGRSSYRGDGKLGPRTPEQPPSPEPRARLPSDGGSWPSSPQETPGTPGPVEESSFFALEEEQLAALPWERRSFPLSEAELQWLQEEEEEEHPEDPSSTSARSQSTDSGISVGSLELSPIALLSPPPPVRQGQDLSPKPPAAFPSETQDSPSLQPPESSLPPVPLSLSPKPPPPLLQTRPAPS
ncbi:KAT8 regulatory NSL complex subunit 1 [Anguilla anguilla]|uniref:KAT8 regulatory NSL complex subunit 1 n=1 Tax=Anguilla anguilla TaxID=7936 RepID=UPI0015AA108F|nr:KAT8 regulatory NSL complex subunit 1 [Anguilla anguilla]